MKRPFRRVVAAVHNTIWAILPQKLQQICGVLDLRSQGVTLSREEIAARIGQQATRPAATQQGQIAVLNIYGTMAPRLSAMQDISGGVSAEAISRAFDAAVRNPDVSAIVLNIDSPGGSVGGIAELSQKIFEARGTKPIIAVANGQMASAAYWVGSAADEIVATPSATDLGSIGAMTIHTDDTKAMAKVGITRTLVASAEFKAEGWGPMTEGFKSHLQGRVDAIGQQFVADVARNRKVAVTKVLSDFGKGRTFLAQDAVSHGLADRIGTLESVLAELGVVAGSSSVQAESAKSAQQKDLVMNFEQWCRSQGHDPAKLDATKLAAMNALYAEIVAGTTVDGISGRISAIMMPTTTTTSATVANAVSAADIVAQVKLTSLSAEAQLDLIGSLTKQVATLTYSGMLDQVNAAVVKANPPAGATTIQGVAAESDKFVASARDAMLSRAWAGQLPDKIYSVAEDDFVAWKPARNDYGLQSSLGLASRCLIQAGVPAHRISQLPPEAIAQLVMGANPRSFGIVASDGSYNVTGMFANIFYDASNVMLRRSYAEANTTFQVWMRQGESVKDFKPVHKVIAGELPDPKAIPEDGEFEETTTTDGRESYKLTVWGERFSISWQAIVNDQLGSFAEISAKQGRAMRRKQNKLAYGVLKDNAALSDTGALFNATALTTAGGHNNLATGSATPTVVTLNAQKARMRAMTGLNVTDQTVLNLEPEWILSGGALEGTIDTLLMSMADPAATHSGVANKWRNGLTPIYDEQLGAAGGGSDTAWYLACNHRDVDTIEYAYLQGLEQPRLLQRDSYNTLGLKFDIYQAFAVKALDFRGLQKHAGA